MKTIPEMQAEVVERNKAKGWYDKPRSFGDDIALLHSEVSEAYEAYRQWGMEDATKPGGYDSQEACYECQTAGYQVKCSHHPKPEGVGSELADLLIRLLDTCDRHDIDLVFEYERKMTFNWTRSYRHGEKLV
jgi:NTP pyrophosphatase (non-canonical NTP hydrolase)